MAPGQATAQVPPESEVVIITGGHTDAWFPQVDTATDGSVSAHLRMHDSTYGTLEWADVVVHNSDASKLTLPAEYTPATDMSFLAPPGTEVWVSPQTQNPALPWLGVETGDDSLDYMSTPAQALHLRLDAVQGLDGGAAPGEFVIWEAPALTTGDRVFYSTVKGIPGGRGMGNGGHGHYSWGVTAPGVYCVGFSLDLPLPGGARGHDFQWLTLVFGDAFDPEVIQPCGRVLDEPTVPMHDVDLQSPVGPVVSTTTKTAIDLRLIDGELDVLWREDDRLNRTRGPAFDIDDVIVHREAYNTADTDRVAAMSSRDKFQRRGWDTTDVRPSDVAGEITWRITGIDGPGNFRIGRTLPTIPVFDTDPAVGLLEYEVITGHNTHISTWAFSQPGRYCISMEWSVPLPDGSVATRDTVLTWLEDGPVDPAAPFTTVNGVRVYQGALLGENPANLEPCVAPEPEPDPSLSQTITATLDADQGALIVSVDPEDRDVVMSSAQLDDAGDRWVAEGELRPVSVVDTRSGAPGWTVSGVASAFFGDQGSFGSNYLGWAPTVDGVAGVQPGQPVAPGFPVGDGLSVSATLGSAAAGSGTGTSVLGALLELELPTSTPVGEYQSVLTITTI